MSEIQISAKDGGRFMAYHAAPQSGGGPGLVLIQEIFGVNKVMRDLADHFAAKGYHTACPDLFWRQKPGIQLTDKSEAEWNQAFGLLKGFDEAKGIEDLSATLEHLRQMKGVAGKVGSVGYCLGGRLAYLMATCSKSDANVGYYPIGIDNNLDEAAKITKPLLLHIAEEDQFCPKDAQQKIVAALSTHKQVTLHRYPGVNHAFAREGGANYDDNAAMLANNRTAEFLKTHLG
jgi:carboxymethylenebutenolidase